MEHYRVLLLLLCIHKAFSYAKRISLQKSHSLIYRIKFAERLDVNYLELR